MKRKIIFLASLFFVLKDFGLASESLNIFLNFKYFKMEEDSKNFLNKNSSVDGNEVPPATPPIVTPPVPSLPKRIFFNDVWLEGQNLDTSEDLTVDSTSGFRYGMGAVASGYTLTNKNTVTINGNSESLLVGMVASNGGKVINDGTINLDDFGKGMYITDGSAGSNSGNIHMIGVQGIGVYVRNNSTFTNEVGGVIDGIGRSGIYLSGVGKVVNNGEININNGGLGIELHGNGEAINNGTITITDTTAGMYTIDGGKILNFGTINVNAGPENGGLVTPNGAMYVQNSGTAENSGIINVNGSNYSGMTGQDNVVVTNSPLGTINTNSANTYAFCLKDGAVAINKGEVNLHEFGSLGTGLHGTGGTIYNFGNIDATNGNSLGTSDIKLVMEKGGILNGPTLNTDLYIGNSFTPLYLDSIGSTRQIELGVNGALNGNVYSNNPIYKILENNNGTLTISRMSFQEVMTPNNLGDYLDRNYYESTNPTKDNIYNMLLSTIDQNILNDRASKIFGLDINSTLLNQTLDSVNYSLDSLTDNLLSNSGDEKDYSYIFGYTGDTIKQQRDDYITPYRQNIYSVHMGVAKRLNSTFRLGGVFSYSSSRVKYDGDSRRDDDIYQGTGFVTYNKEEVKGVLSLFGGYANGDLNRKLNIDYLNYDGKDSYTYENINENIDSKIKNSYFGIDGVVAKRYWSGDFYLEPKANLRYIYISEKSIDESGSDYALKLKKLNTSYSLGKLELGIGRIFNLTNNWKNDFKIKALIESELGDPKRSVEFTLDKMSKDSLKLDMYEKDKTRKKIGIDWDIFKNSKENLRLYVNYKYVLETSNEYEVSTGVEMRF